MSKFDEICQAFTAAKATHFQERDACCDLATHLAEGMRKYLETPTFHLYFMPRSREGSSVKARTARDAVWFQDGEWHFLIGMIVVHAGDGPRYQTGPEMVLAELVVQRPDGGFSVGLQGWPDRFSIPADTDYDACLPLYEFVARQMVEVYRQPHLRFLESGQETQRVLGRK
jgi:hypothetical protein